MKSILEVQAKWDHEMRHCLPLEQRVDEFLGEQAKAGKELMAESVEYLMTAWGSWGTPHGMLIHLRKELADQLLMLHEPGSFSIGLGSEDRMPFVVAAYISIEELTNEILGSLTCPQDKVTKAAWADQFRQAAKRLEELP